jgi:general secretion pathway protein D
MMLLNIFCKRVILFVFIFFFILSFNFTSSEDGFVSLESLIPEENESKDIYDKNASDMIDDILEKDSEIEENDLSSVSYDEKVLPIERIETNNVDPTEKDSKSSLYVVSWNDFVEPWKIFKDEGAILLNFLNADLINLLKYFEGEFKVTFITDDAITPILQGGKSLVGSKINFVSHNPLSRKEAWNVFVTLLEIAGVTLQPGSMSRTYRVVPLEKDSPLGYTRGPLPLYVGIEPDELPEGDMRIRYLYIVKNTSLEAVKNIIKAMQSPASPEPIDIPEVRGVLMTDRIYNIKTVMTIIKEIDQITTPEEFVVFKLKRAEAIKVAELYKALVKDDQQLGISSNTRFLGPKRTDTITYFDPLVRIIPEPRTNSLLIFGPVESINKAISFIKKYEDGKVQSPYLPVHVYPLMFTQAEAIAKLLEQAIQFKSETDAGKFGGIRDGEKYFSNVLIVPEVSTNVLLITASEDEYVHLCSILKKIDVEQPQITLDVIMMSVDINKAKQLGTQLRNKEGALGKNVNFQTGVLDSSTGVVPNYENDQAGNVNSGATRLLGNLIQLVTGSSSQTGASIITLGNDAYGVWGIIKMLQTETEAKIISDPFLVTTNKYEANISVGETRRVAATSITSSNNQSQSYSNSSAQIQIKITPQINSDNMITMTIDIENSQFIGPSGDSASAGNKVTRSVNTAVLVPSGETVALGGLTYELVSETQDRVPWLSRIPLIGWLFKSKKTSRSKSVLVIFIQPKIITGKGDDEKFKNVYKELKMSSESQDNSDGYCPIQKLFFGNDSMKSAYEKSMVDFIKKDENVFCDDKMTKGKS